MAHRRRVLRFWSHEGMENLEEVLPKILEMGGEGGFGAPNRLHEMRAVFGCME